VGCLSAERCWNQNPSVECCVLSLGGKVLDGADLPGAKFHGSGDTTSCKMTGVTLHGVVVNDLVNAKDVVGKDSSLVGSVINARAGSLDLTHHADNER